MIGPNLQPMNLLEFRYWPMMLVVSLLSGTFHYWQFIASARQVVCEFLPSVGS